MQNARIGIEPALRTLFGFIEGLDVMEGEGTNAQAVQSLNTIINTMTSMHNTRATGTGTLHHHCCRQRTDNIRTMILLFSRTDSGVLYPQEWSR
jgi:hypothetical protein